MIRTVFVVLFIVLFLILSIPVLIVEWIIGKFNPQLRDFSSLRIVQWAFRVILWISGTKVDILGEENVPKDAPVLYIGNHRSFFDIVISYSRCPLRTGYVAKKEMEVIPLLSTWMRRLHCLFLDREDIKQGLKTILTAIEKVKSGISICIYPEGTRSRSQDETQMLDFHDGAFKIATKSKCPIIPVAVVHTSAILEDHFPSIRSAHVILEYGKPIYPDQLSKEEQRHLSDYTRKILTEMLRKNRERI
ncbi:MAG: 1-acylglycerol-3-phosphate O-acyltransferase [Clostridiales bacterium]|nr:1-acylglycerol-3-phosphate O-acyltransferase [Clostridiales bacterium]